MELALHLFVKCRRAEYYRAKSLFEIGFGETGPDFCNMRLRCEH